MTCISHAEPVEEVPHTLSLHLSDSEKDLFHLLFQQPHGQLALWILFLSAPEGQCEPRPLDS